MPEVWNFGNQHTAEFDWGHSVFGLNEYPEIPNKR